MRVYTQYTFIYTTGYTVGRNKMNQNKLTKKVIEDMAGGYLPFEKVEEGQSWVNENAFRVTMKSRSFNIGNLRELNGRGFELLCFGIGDDGKLFIEFDIASPKVSA